jgi:23S rRNA pseudouridine2605 synthase
MRLVKFLANAGVASRRASDEIIRAGRVTIEGDVVTDPARDVTEADRVDVDGAPVRLAAERVVYVINKPRGVVSTASDPQRRPTVVSLIDTHLRLYPVGRLDIDTTGLLLLTNDGELAHRLTHPSFEVPRTYQATLGGPPITDKAIRQLRTGVVLEDGRTAPARVKRLGDRSENRIELEIREGRNRQIKRMCEAVGHKVTALQRTSFGPLQLGGLGIGGSRKLSERESAALAREPGPPSSSR